MQAGQAPLQTSLQVLSDDPLLIMLVEGRTR
jgi:hypothetical protein